MRPLLQTDLDHIVGHTEDLWPELRGARLLLTGGTGFFGRWLTESFLYANRILGLGASLAILSRNPAGFAARAPHLCADPALVMLQGDIRSFGFPKDHFHFIIHAVTYVVADSWSAEEQYTAIADRTRRVLECAAASGTRRLLLTNTGAVYGPQPATVSHIGEQHPMAPSDSAYTLGRRAAEELCLASGLDCLIARGFTFFGPHLPLDGQFAVGNFLRDALRGQPIEIAGDGTPLRSYLYAADLAIWLWRILLRGEAGRAYNVGSEEAVSIRELAGRVAAAVAPVLPVHVARPSDSAGRPPARYVPSTERARSELGLDCWIGLDEGLRRTAAWHRNAG